jgi:hypothetical protein
MADGYGISRVASVVFMASNTDKALSMEACGSTPVSEYYAHLHIWSRHTPGSVQVEDFELPTAFVVGMSAVS